MFIDSSNSNDINTLESRGELLDRSLFKAVLNKIDSIIEQFSFLDLITNFKINIVINSHTVNQYQSFALIKVFSEFSGVFAKIVIEIPHIIRMLPVRAIKLTGSWYLNNPMV